VEPGVRGGRVLLADDNADMRGYVARLLASHGIEVTTASDGEEALAKARAQLPDLVLTDVMMPRLDGFGLLAAIRADAALRSLPVMLLSARAGEEARVEGLAAGADDYLTKPFGARDLVARVGANLRLNRERRQAASAVREAQKLEALGRLTGGVAHDFNNLMMVVSGGISVLERQPDPARQRQALEGMRRAVTRGSELTRQLLTFGGNKSLSPKPVDLPACIGGMENLLNRTLGGNVRVISQFPPDLWPVLADPGELEMMLLNLGANARDAMPGGGTVSITTENTSNPQGLPAGDYVRVSIGDTGVGMAPDVRERAFDPFFTTKALGKGSGVGLAQVYGFAKESGGSADIDSAPGRGTTVTLLLPRSPVGVPAREAPRSSCRCSGSAACWWWRTTTRSRSWWPKCWSTWATSWCARARRPKPCSRWSTTPASTWCSPT
jgi:signal transduction histidine kinase